jgi:hypothetical protein
MAWPNIAAILHWSSCCTQKQATIVWRAESEYVFLLQYVPVLSSFVPQDPLRLVFHLLLQCGGILSGVEEG